MEKNTIKKSEVYAIIDGIKPMLSVSYENDIYQVWCKQRINKETSLGFKEFVLNIAKRDVETS